MIESPVAEANEHESVWSLARPCWGLACLALDARAPECAGARSHRGRNVWRWRGRFGSSGILTWPGTNASGRALAYGCCAAWA